MNDFIFTSYCFDNAAAGGDYYAQQIRLKESILKIYPDANLHFIHEPEEIGKPRFQKSLYGFKVQLIRECLAKRFEKIIFFDTSITLQNKIAYWFDIIDKYGILSIGDDQLLKNAISDKCRKDFGIEIPDSWHLTGGSVYVFDFDNDLCKRIFETWAEYERLGLFGTQKDFSDGRLGAHRMDETCMALSLYTHKSSPLYYEVMKYGYQKPDREAITCSVPVSELIALKKHFK